MITIGHRIRLAIYDIDRGEFEVALEHASIALDITAQRYYGSPKSSGGIYKRLHRRVFMASGIDGVGWYQHG